MATQWLADGLMPYYWYELTNEQFMDFLCNFFGVPNPACADVKDKLVHTRGSRRGAVSKPVGACGEGLLSAHLPGDGWRLQHDTIKKCLVRVALDHGAQAREEIYGLFAHVFDTIRGRVPLQDWEQVPARERHAAVPDIGITLDGGCERLFELKTMTPCPSRYRECSRGGLPAQPPFLPVHVPLALVAMLRR